MTHGPPARNAGRLFALMVAVYYAFLAVGIHLLLVFYSVDRALAVLAALAGLVGLGAFSVSVHSLSQRCSDTHIVRSWSEGHAVVSLVIAIAGLAGHATCVPPMWGLDAPDWRLVLLAVIIGACVLHIAVLHHVLPWSAVRKPGAPSEFATLMRHWRVLFAALYYPSLLMGLQALLVLHSVDRWTAYWVWLGVLVGFAFLSAKLRNLPRDCPDTTRRMLNLAYGACSCAIVFVGLAGYAYATRSGWGGHLFERRAAALGLIVLACAAHSVVLHRYFPWWPGRTGSSSP